MNRNLDPDLLPSLAASQKQLFVKDRLFHNFSICPSHWMLQYTYVVALLTVNFDGVSEFDGGWQESPDSSWLTPPDQTRRHQVVDRLLHSGTAKEKEPTGGRGCSAVDYQ